MGLKAREIQLRLFRVLHVSFEISYTFMQRHPLVSGAMSVFFILYIFLSYIYNFLVFLSPFLVCIAIFVRIFWSSEQTQDRCVKRDEKKGDGGRVEAKDPPKMLKNERRGLLYKFPSQNATSRRKNFTGKKLDVYGGLEIKAKDLSTVFRNEFTKKNSEFRKINFFEEDIGSWEAPKKPTLFSESSKLNRVKFGDNGDSQEKKIENMKKIEKIEDEKKAQEDGNKAGELTEDDQKNQMDLGICEVERNKRLESLIARRRARKQLKLQIENGLADMKSVVPNQITPLFITRINPFDSPKEFDGFDDIEMPGSAPSCLRSPFDIPYDPFEEKPNLTGDSFAQEFTSPSKDISLEPREEDIDAREYRLAFPRVKTLQGKEIHDKPEQLKSQETSESEQEILIPPREEAETAHTLDEKCEIDSASIKHEEVNNVEAAKSMSGHSSEQDLIPTTTNAEEDRILEKLGPSVPKPPEMVLNSSISQASATKINDSLYESLSSPDKNREGQDVSLTGGLICHTPSCSLASDLQVEVSEVGSPTLTVDDSHETVTTIDGESIMYDGDIDKDITSGSEDMWGASLHSRDIRRGSEQDILEINSWRDIGSPLPLQNLDEDNAADVSSMSSRSDMPDDTPTYAMSSDHTNIFGNLKDFVTENGAPQSSYSSVVLARWKRMMRLMDTRVNHLPHEMRSEKSGELFKPSKNLSKTQVIDDGNKSPSSEQENAHNSRSDEDPSTSVMQQETIDEISVNSSSSSSPRSVLTIDDHATSSAYNQETQVDVQQINVQDISQEILNGEDPPVSMLQNIQPPMDDLNVESHNSDLSHPQDQAYPPIQESNISSNMNGAEVCDKEDKEKFKNDENNEEKLTPLIRQDASAERQKLSVVIPSVDKMENSGELFDCRVPLISLILESTSESPRENEYTTMRQEETAEPHINVETTDTSSDEEFEGKHSDLNENEAVFLSCISAGETNKLSQTNQPNHSSEEVDYSKSESKQVVEDHVEKEKLNKESPRENEHATMRQEKTVEPHINADAIDTSSDEEFVGKHSDLNENESMLLSYISAGETNKLSQTNQPNHCSEEVNYLKSESKQVVEDHVEKEKLDKGNNISEDSPPPITTKVTNFEDTNGECDKMNKNEAINQDLNKNETMILSETTRESDQVSNIEYMKDLEEKTSS